MTDEQALEQLETLIATQRPAAQPWQPCTDYSFEARKAIEGIHPQLIKDVLEPKQYLDVGCGPGHLVRLLLELDVDAFGCDLRLPDPFPKILSRDRFWHADVTSHFAGRKNYDVVGCRECLEHLTVCEVYAAVRNLCRSAARLVYLTTRFCKAPQHLLSVDTSDDLDPTHRTMLNQSFLRLLFVLEGFRRRPDLETKMDHRHLGRVLVYERVA